MLHTVCRFAIIYMYGHLYMQLVQAFVKNPEGEENENKKKKKAGWNIEESAYIYRPDRRHSCTNWCSKNGHFSACQIGTGGGETNSLYPGIKKKKNYMCVDEIIK